MQAHHTRISVGLLGELAAEATIRNSKTAASSLRVWIPILCGVGRHAASCFVAISIEKIIYMPAEIVRLVRIVIVFKNAVF